MRRLYGCALAGVWLALLAIPAQAQFQWTPGFHICSAVEESSGLDDAEALAKIKAALPNSATVEPKQPRKLLVFTLCKGFVHRSIPYGAEALRLMGEQTGAYEAVISEDPEMFRPENLEQFDAVCMLNTTGELWDDAALKESLLAFVRGGKGIVGIHAATDCFYNWADFGEMMGGYFNGHPWNANDTVTVKIDDPGHPVNQVFRGMGFEITDEIYQLKDHPYSRSVLRVLLSLDTAKTDMTKKGLSRGVDGDYAVAWVRSYGQGRTFYCSLGHNEMTYWNPKVLQHYLDGIQFALGDLAASTLPSDALPEGYAEQARTQQLEGALDELMPAIAAYEVGGGDAALTTVRQLITDGAGHPERLALIAQELARTLHAGATRDAKYFVCEQLSRIGGPDELSYLTPLLLDEAVAEPALYAIERIPGDAADRALVDMLPRVPAAVRVGIFNALGERQSGLALDPLSRALSDPDEGVVKAAVIALGKIGSVGALEALNRVQPKIAPALRVPLAEARLRCADALLRQGNGPAAQRIYADIYESTESQAVYLAAFRGLVQAQGDEAVDTLIEAMERFDPALRATAAEAAAEVGGGSAATAALAAALPRLEPDTQVVLIHALARRGDRAALSAVTYRLRSAHETVRLAALDALVALGDATSVSALVRATAEGSEASQEAARKTLARLRGADVNATIAGVMKHAVPTARTMLLGVLAERLATDSVDAVFDETEHADSEVRAAAYGTLAVVGTPSNAVKVIGQVAATEDDAVRTAAADCIVALLSRPTASGQGVSAVLAALDEGDTGPTAKAALLRVLGRLGAPEGLGALRAALSASNPIEVRMAAAEALAGWPTPEPLETLKTAAQGAEDAAYRKALLDALVHVLALPSERTAAESLAEYTTALELAREAGTKAQLLEGLAEVRDPGAVALAKTYLEDPALKESAQNALDRLNSHDMVPSASHNAEKAALAIDGDPATRWDTGTQQAPGQWFQVDLGWEKTVTKITLDSAGSAGDYPRGYEVFVSNNPDEPGKAVATGTGSTPVVEIAVEPVKGRYVRIVQTGETDGMFWSIHELRVEAE